jgi:chromate transport protein ChrA
MYKQGDSLGEYFIFVTRIGFRPYGDNELGSAIFNSAIKDPVEHMRFLFGAALSHPSDFIIIFIKKMARSWYATAMGWRHKEILLIQVPVILSALWGLTVNVSNKNNRRNLLFCFFSILYFWFLTAVTASVVRIMIAGMPFVFVFSAMGIIDIYNRVRCGLDKRIIK